MRSNCHTVSHLNAEWGSVVIFTHQVHILCRKDWIGSWMILKGSVDVVGPKGR
jgi:hypothetical protein